MYFYSTIKSLIHGRHVYHCVSPGQLEALDLYLTRPLQAKILEIVVKSGAFLDGFITGMASTIMISNSLAQFDFS